MEATGEPRQLSTSMFQLHHCVVERARDLHRRHDASSLQDRAQHVQPLGGGVLQLLFEVSALVGLRLHQP